MNPHVKARGVSIPPSARLTDSLAPLGRLLIGITALGGLFFLLATFPPGHPSLYLVLGGYALAGLVNPYAWLLLLPGLLVSYDLTPWSGRAGVNELDMLVLLTLALGCMAGPGGWREQFLCRSRSFPRLGDPAPRGGAERMKASIAKPVAALSWSGYILAAFVTALAASGLPTGPLMGLVYYAPEAEALQLRGPLYALILLLAWIQLYRHDPIKAERYLLLGGCIAALALGVLLSWERGVFGDLLSPGAYYTRLRSLLDFSSSYRVTGILAAMHTGGEALDGVLMIVIPLALTGMFRLPGWQKGLAMVAFLGATYGLIATFTRTTYASYGVVVVLFGLVMLYQNQRRLGNLKGIDGLLLAGGALALLLLGPVYGRSGALGVLAAGGMLMLGLFSAAYPKYGTRSLLVLPLYGGLVIFGLYAQASSKWVTPEVTDVFFQALTLIYIALISWALSRCLSLRTGPSLFVSTALLLVFILLVAALGGNRMNTRFLAVERDLETRIDHWSTVLEAMDDEPASLLFGMGPGSFPVAFALTHPRQVLQVGGLQILEGPEFNYLRLSRGSDLSLAQRMDIRPHQKYRLSMRVRNEEQAVLSLGFCERNIIYTGDEGGHCANQRHGLAPSVGAWQQVSLPIQSRDLGAEPIWRRWPTVFYLKNVGRHSIDIADISIYPENLRFDLVENGNFEQGMDYWYTYNDIKHLPWHIKNLYLALWFEGGALGLGLTLLLFAVALKTAARGGLAGSGLATGAGLAVVGVLTVGMMGNPLDSARVSLLFYWLVLILAFSSKSNPALDQGRVS